MKGILRIKLLASLALAFGSAAMAEIQPEARAVFERMIESSGGREKIKNLETARIKVVMSMPAMGMSMNSTFVRKAPNHFYIEQEVPGMGTVKSGYDGETGWAFMPMQGYREMDEDELAQGIEDQHIHGELKYAERYESAEVAGAEEIGNEEVVVVKAVRKLTGTADTIRFDKDTGLLKKIETVASGGDMGEVPVEMEVLDYTEVDGFTMPAKVEMRNPAMNINMEFQSYEFNVEVDDAIFSPPEE